jgi:hypothetical protein
MQMLFILVFFPSISQAKYCFSVCNNMFAKSQEAVNSTFIFLNLICRIFFQHNICSKII